MEQPKRRLSAIWFADIVGYSTLSTRDEPAAFALVNLLQALCREIVPAFEGRIVKFIGDACLCEFASTDSAVRSAVSLQERFVAEAAAQGEPSQLRIGVHLGEVTATPDGDLYGDGVNTASRLHHTAEPGRVVISEDVWRVLRQRPEFRFAPLGSMELRGITTRVEVYDVLFGSRAALAPSATAPTAAAAPRRTARAAWVAAAVVVIGAAIAAFAWFKPFATPEPAPSPAAPPAAASPAPATSSPAAKTEPVTPPPTRSTAPPPSKPAETPPASPRLPQRTPVTSPPVPAASATRSPFAPPLVRALIEKLAAAITSDRPREALAALGPGTMFMSGRGVQQLKDSFGENVTLRVGRIEPLQVADDQVTVRFIVFARGAARAESPLAYVATINRDAAGELRIKDLRREWEGRRGGRGQR
jgi:class 3 adenylate cyclase